MADGERVFSLREVPVEKPPEKTALWPGFERLVNPAVAYVQGLLEVVLPAGVLPGQCQLFAGPSFDRRSFVRLTLVLSGPRPVMSRCRVRQSAGDLEIFEGKILLHRPSDEACPEPINILIEVKQA